MAESTDPPTLTAFLLARVGEDQTIAEKALAEAREYGEITDPPEPYSSHMPHMTGLGVYANNADSSGNVIVALDPERAVAEFHAKREAVFDHRRMVDWPGYCSACKGRDLGAAWPCRTIRLIAVPYAAHPDYRQEWRP